MKGDSKQIYNVFWNTQHFIIPIYQRRYSWKITQCSRLFDDIEEACRNNRNHFIGCIISASDGGRGDYLVIDGQQRITTISLLLKAAYDLLSSGVLKSSDPYLADKILETFLKNRYGDNDKQRIKLNLLNEDGDEYFKLFDSDRRLSDDSEISVNYGFFLSRLKDSLLSIDELYSTITNLEVIDITLSHEDNPQLIFESLNSTGLALTEGDKIRNFILMGLSSKEQVGYYTDYWSKIEKNSGNDDPSSFVRDYLSLKTLRIPNIKSVYQEFRKYWMNSGLTPIEILEDLRNYSYSYNKLLSANTGIIDVDLSIQRLSWLEITVIRPFAIEVINLQEKDVISREEATKAFSIIESYIFRRLICALPSNALNKVFAILANDIRKLDGSYNDFSNKLSFILFKKSGSARFPSDEEFSEEIRGRNIYGNTLNRVIWYIFSRLENYGTLETKDIWLHLARGDYSIEHIMPQTLSEKWKIAIGKDYANIHEFWVNKLCNLTIVAAPYNSMFSNRPFPEKRDMEHGFKDSGLRINHFIAEKDKWGVEELEERAEAIVTASLSIWTGLQTTYKEHAEDETEITLADEIDFTGRTLSSADFNDTSIPAMEWADFLVEIVRLLYVTDPASITSVTKNAGGLGFDSFLSSFETEKSRRISDNIYLCTDCNTNRKIWFLRHLFNYLNIDKENLEMCVSSPKEKDNYSDYRFRLWNVIIPYLKEATRDTFYPSFQNRKPTASSFLDGFIGIREMHLVSSIGKKRHKVWAYLYIDSGNLNRNKDIFAFFLSRKEEIDERLKGRVEWFVPSDKARRGAIQISETVSFIEDEKRWDEVGKIAGNLMKDLINALTPVLKDFQEGTS